MNDAMLAAAISGSVSLTVAIVGYYLTRRKEREADWRKMKFEIYKEYVSALSQQLNNMESSEVRYLEACNSLTLVAPSVIVSAVQTFNNIFFGKDSGDLGKAIQKLLSALREDVHGRRRTGHQHLSLTLYHKSTKPSTAPLDLSGAS
jgi:hypothetical protein